MGLAPVSHTSHPLRDTQPHTQRRNLKAEPKQQLQRNASNRIVNPGCPVHGAHAHTHARAPEGAVPALASTRRLQNGVPVSPVLTTGGGLALQMLGGRADAIAAKEEEQLLQQLQLQPPMSTYIRAKRGNIRKSGLQLLRPARALVVGQPATLKVRIERGGGLIVSLYGGVWLGTIRTVNKTDRVPVYV